MVFIQICRAIYDYAPQAEGELAISEGDLLFVLEKDDDDWWKAKKKAANEDEDEPEGLIPNNYVEEVGLATAQQLTRPRKPTYLGRLSTLRIRYMKRDVMLTDRWNTGCAYAQSESTLRL